MNIKLKATEKYFDVHLHFKPLTRLSFLKQIYRRKPTNCLIVGSNYHSQLRWLQRECLHIFHRVKRFFR